MCDKAVDRNVEFRYNKSKRNNFVIFETDLTYFDRIRTVLPGGIQVLFFFRKGKVWKEKEEKNTEVLYWGCLSC